MIKNRLDKYISQHYDWWLRQIKRNIAKGMMAEYAEDLLHHLILDIYKMEESKVEGMLDNNKLKWYILSSAGLSLRSSTSPFYKIHRKFKNYSRSGVIDTDTDNPYITEGYDMEEFDSGETLPECLERAVNQLDWYLKALWDKKFKAGWTIQEMYEHYNIGKNHLIKDINKAIAEIRETCK